MANNQLMNEIGEIIGIADILFAETAANSNSPNSLNGSITVNLGFAESGEMQSSQAEVWGTPGIISVPALPASVNNNTDAAQALYYNRNDQCIVFATRDTRTQFLAGNINPGETCVYSPVGQGRLLCKADNSVSLITTDDGTSTGNIISAGVSETGFKVVTPWGTLTLDNTGLNITLSSGASFNMGGTADLASGGSAATISAGNITLNGTCNLGQAPYLPAVASIIPLATPGVPILGSGVGEVVVAAIASSVNISSGITS